LCCYCELLSLQIIKVITNFELGNMLDSLVCMVYWCCLIVYALLSCHIYSHSFSQCVRFGGGIVKTEPAPSSS
jgi:hypothetical protein